MVPMFIALWLKTEECYKTQLTRPLSRFHGNELSGWPEGNISLSSLFFSSSVNNWGCDWIHGSDFQTLRQCQILDMRINSIQGNSKSNSLLFPENPASEKSQEYPRSRAKILLSSPWGTGIWYPFILFPTFPSMRRAYVKHGCIWRTQRGKKYPTVRGGMEWAKWNWKC